MFTLRQLQIFWALVHSPSLTQAAKQLGVSQPALSQQLAKLENALGVRLFERTGSELRLTDAGRFLLDKAEEVLATTDEIQAGMRAFESGRRGRVAVGALSSVARTLVPRALEIARMRIPELELDVHELPPRDMIEQLYGRGLQIALVAETSLAADHLSFGRLPLFSDDYALAVPKSLVLDRVEDPDRDLDPAARRLLRRTIQFSFGTLHQQRVESWYRDHFRRFETTARVRHYETALALVEAGHGVALVPLGATQLNGRHLFDVRLYRAPRLGRSVVALFPSHYRPLEPYGTFLDALREAARRTRFTAIHPPPPFLAAGESGRDGDETESRAEA